MRDQLDSLADLRRARDLMDREFGDEDLHLDRIAGVALMSKSHFVRRFARQFGTTPGAYLSGRRMERAQDLLRYANLTVTEVCHAVGFSSLGSFSSTFLGRVGTTPSEFQASWRDHDQPRIPGCVILMWGSQRLRPIQD